MSKIENLIILILLILLSKNNQNLQPVLNELKKNFSTTSISFEDNQFDKEKIIFYTNFYRRQNGLQDLISDQKLDLSAQKKAEDILLNQYFDHKSPSGKNFTDFIIDSNYKFIIVGENLFMGRPKSEEEVVRDWMESPPHRKNILNKNFYHLGVGFVKGNFKGKEVYVFVQHFGSPEDLCPKPSEDLQTRINENKNKIEILKKELDDLLERITKNENPYEVLSLIDEYNRKVHSYNELIIKTKSFIEDYNLKVKEYNSCILRFQNQE